MLAAPGYSQTISGNLSVCLGASRTTLSIGATGGVWSSGDITKATINPATGEVTGVAAGTAAISYSIPPSTVYTAVVTVNAFALTSIGFASGSSVRCTGSIPAMCTVSPVSGNAWSSSDPAIATINSSGILTPSASTPGTATITYHHGDGGCDVTAVITVSPTPTVTIASAMCNATTQTATALPAGGTWASSNTTVGTIGSATGSMTAFTGGTTTIKYTSLAGCETPTTVTVLPLPAGILGTLTFCAGNTSYLSSSYPGGAWSSSNTSVATVDPSTGVVTGVTPGNATISYTMGSTGCARTVVVTVNPGVAAISGPDFVCVGQAITLTDASGGGWWVSSNTSRATVTTYTGVVVGMSAGTVTISYRLTGGCFAIKTVTVNSTMAGISGGSIVCVGSAITLSHAVSGGTWSVSNGNATIDAATGELTGVTAGAVTATYTLGPGCIKTLSMLVKANPGGITGATSVCEASVTTVADPTAGGTWTSSDPSVATIGSTSALVTGIAAGTTTITYRISSTGCIATRVQSVTALPATISGTPVVCVGNTSSLSSAPSGGTWASSNTYAATIGSSTGLLTAMAPGTSKITYTLSTGCRTVTTVTLNNSPVGIAGTFTVCPGATTSLSCLSSGGTWSSSDPSIASVASTGLVSGVSAGLATISYTLSNGCYRTAEVTVHATAAASAITGPANVCLGGLAALNDSVGGGVWSSSNTAIASVDSATGEVSGLALGSAFITYTVTTPCGSAYAVKGVTVITVPVVDSISGPSSVTVGSSVALTDGTPGGIWSSSDTTIATVDSAGVITGIAAGSVSISYTVTGECGSVSEGKAIEVRMGAPLCVPSEGLVAWYPFNGNANDESGNGRDGEVFGAALAADRFDNTGHAYFFDGVAGTRIQIDLSVSLTLSSRTFSGWMKFPAEPTNYYPTFYEINGDYANVLGNNSEYIAAGTVGKYWWGWGSGAGAQIGKTALNDNEWHHLALVADSAANIYKMYVDGSLDTFRSFSNSTVVTTFITFGSGGTESTFTGILDDIGIWNRALSDAEILQLFTGEPTVDTITGPSFIAIGLPTTLTNGTPGGTWSSSNSEIASVGSAGAVTGITPGTATISYIVASECGTATATHTVTVSIASKPGVSDNVASSGVQISPNPTSGVVNVTATTFGTVAICTIDGRELQQTKVVAGNNRLDMPAGLADGIYLVRFCGDDGSRQVTRLVFRQ